MAKKTKTFVEIDLPVVSLRPDGRPYRMNNFELLFERGTFNVRVNVSKENVLVYEPRPAVPQHPYDLGNITLTPAGYVEVMEQLEGMFIEENEGWDD